MVKQAMKHINRSTALLARHALIIKKVDRLLALARTIERNAELHNSEARKLIERMR